ncbi:Uncharacterized protein APZ42_009208, partial [Daphnia magna]
MTVFFLFFQPAQYLTQVRKRKKIFMLKQFFSITKMPRNHQVPIHQVPSNMYNMYEEFEVEDCLNRRVVQFENRRKVQYLLKYVGYDTPEWTDFSNCNNCRSLIREFLRNERAATVDQAGPADVNGEVELEGEALLYCEALLASEASPLGIGDSAGEPDQLSDGQDSNLEQPAILLPGILLPAVETPAIMPPAVETPAIMPPMASKQAVRFCRHEKYMYMRRCRIKNTPEYLLVWLFGSQQCESFFRGSRALCPVGLNKPNMTEGEFLDRAREVDASLLLQQKSSDFIYRRVEQKRNRCGGSLNALKEVEIPSDDDL